MAIVDLRDDWSDLLKRRAALATSLVPYRAIIEAWARWEPAGEPPEWTRAQCEEQWRKGVPLLAELASAIEHGENERGRQERARLEIDLSDVEELVAVGMEAIAATRPQEAEGMRKIADAWDEGRVRVDAFFPAPGGVGEKLARELGIKPALVAFLACAGLRPALEWALRSARAHDTDGAWTLGICPFCGGPPGFGDIAEDGRLQLSCHLCGGTWVFSRVRCPLCGADEPRSLARLEAGGADEAYFIAACTRCKGYVKHVDRRQRWNARSPVVEDWGSPHLDLAARQAAYWRPLPTLLEIAEPA